MRREGTTGVVVPPGSDGILTGGPAAAQRATTGIPSAPASATITPRTSPWTSP
jgi:hypothetical protein